jgi:peptidyl-prolyl cis-trans isomerase B (cyclophilin B)
VPAALVLSILLAAQAPAAPQGSFKTPLAPDEMRGKQAVVETSLGTFVLDLLPDAAPNHVGYFIKLAREGAYDGTTFHRLVKYGIVQGGDPLSRDAAKPELYGRGGFGALEDEPNAEKHTRGAVSAVLQPGNPNSGGAQFFICVVDGMDVVEKISAEPVDASGRATGRIEIRTVTIRDTPPPEPEPFADTPVEELARYRAVLETSLGEITIGFMPDKAPNTVRQFLRLAQAGVYDGMAFHRVVPGFVIQTGAMISRSTPLTDRQKRIVRAIPPEFNDTHHVKGVVSMARGDDPDSASTSFFIVTGDNPGLDGVYTAFGRVVAGLDVVDAIQAVARNGEAPVERVDLKTVRVEKQQDESAREAPEAGSAGAGR